MRGPLDAVGVLTRVPVRSSGEPDLAASAPWFPVVGALTGVAVAGVGVGSAAVWPAYVAAVLAVTIDVLLTGALHLDGLADCADGSAGDSRERRLAIMKDHAVGVYGAAAIVLDLLLRTAALTAILAWSPASAIAAVVATWTLSRAAMLPPALLMSYARTHGTGQSVIERLTLPRSVAGVAVALLVAGAVLVPAAGVLALLGAVAGGCAGALIPALWAARRLGGATGDVLGAVAECALIGALLGVVATL